MPEQSNAGQAMRMQIKARKSPSRMDISALRCQILFHVKRIFKSMRFGLEGWAAASAMPLQMKIGKTKAEVTDLLMDEESRTTEAIQTYVGPMASEKQAICLMDT